MSSLADLIMALEPDDQPETVLLAEPDEELRNRAAEALRQDGFDVVEVEDGMELRDYLEAFPGSPRLSAPDIIVCETSLPGESALFLLAQLRQRDRVTPFILIASPQDPPDDNSCAKLCGADFVLPWPLDIDQLRTAVHITA
jgi:DNA-binding response OmpR family regulator